MNIQTFLNQFEQFNDNSFKENLQLVIQNDNLKDALKLSEFLDINGYQDTYSDFFNIAFNSISS